LSKVSDIAAAASVLVTGKMQRALEQGFALGHDLSELLAPLPVASSSSKSVVSLSASDTQKVQQWKDALSPTVLAEVERAVLASQGATSPPYAVAVILDAEFSRRSNRIFASARVASRLSPDGVGHACGLSVRSFDFEPPAASVQVLALEGPSDRLSLDSMPFYCLMQPGLTPELWHLCSAITKPVASALLDNRNLVSYAYTLTLALYVRSLVFSSISASSMVVFGLLSFSLGSNP
jgi:hypothetical protein